MPCQASVVEGHAVPPVASIDVDLAFVQQVPDVRAREVILHDGRVSPLLGRDSASLAFLKMVEHRHEKELNSIDRRRLDEVALFRSLIWTIRG